MERAECVVVGAGVVGIAIARSLALEGREVVVLERATAIGTETSARSNEVIHAGIYYRPGSPQARFCAAAAKALYAFCAERGVAHRRVGKLLIATAADEVAWLRDMAARGRANGAPDLRWLDAAAARALEPALRCAAALHSPATGILDSHGLMLALEGDLRAHGGAIAFGSEATGAHASADGGFVLAVAQAAGGVERLGCAILVNAAGLRANDLARRIAGLPPERVPRLHLRRGTFFALRGRAPFRHLVVPTGTCYQGGGIYTLDLAGAARFGPDEDWTETIDYRLDEGRAAGFYRAVRRYYPDLPEDALEPAYVGIQPRLSPPGAPPADWIIDGPEGHGLPGLWNLFGIDSPGLTCAMALGAHVAGRVAAA